MLATLPIRWMNCPRPVRVRRSPRSDWKRVPADCARPHGDTARARALADDPVKESAQGSVVVLYSAGLDRRGEAWIAPSPSGLFVSGTEVSQILTQLGNAALIDCFLPELPEKLVDNHAAIAECSFRMLTDLAGKQPAVRIFS
jgi:hypothetical protein